MVLVNMAAFIAQHPVHKFSESCQLFILECIYCPSWASVGELWELVTEGFFPMGEKKWIDGKVGENDKKLC